MEIDQLREQLDAAVNDDDLAAALIFAEQLLVKYSEAEDRHATAAALHSVGHLRLRLGQHEAALKSLTACVDLYESLGDPQNLFLSLSTLADAFAEAGELVIARSLYNRVAEGCAVNTPTGNEDAHRWHSLWGKALFGVGQIAAIAGEVDHAREVLDMAQKLVATLPRNETWNTDRQRSLAQIREVIGELEFRH